MDHTSLTLPKLHNHKQINDSCCLKPLDLGLELSKYHPLEKYVLRKQGRDLGVVCYWLGDPLSNKAQDQLLDMTT